MKSLTGSYHLHSHNSCQCTLPCIQALLGSQCFTIWNEPGGWAQEVVGEGSEVLQMSEGVFVEHLADYPEMELSWLKQLYEGSTQGPEGAGATLNNVMNSMLIPSLSGLTKKVSAAARLSRPRPTLPMPQSDSIETSACRI